jgi:hypothetical protein
MIAYHFVGKTLRDGRPIPADGEWLEEQGQIEMCHKGLHASEHVADAVRYAPGITLCLVELAGDIKKGDDKLCAQRRRIIARFDATELLRADARASARSVLHLWKAPDVVKQYLETGDESIRQKARNAASLASLAAYAAAYAAAAAAYAAAAAADAYAADAAAAAYAADAAAAAAYAAAADAYAAAYAAAAVRRTKRDEARARLKAAVDAKFAEMGFPVGKD